jgi:alpha-galactosidase
MKSLTLSLVAASAIQNVALAAPAKQDESNLMPRLDNGLGLTPALGYNNWVSICPPSLPYSSIPYHTISPRVTVSSANTPTQNNGGCTHATADSALKVANLMVSLGLKAAGYQYLNIDDCWTTKQRASNGHLVPDPAKWPQGMKPVIDQIHAMGLKFGLYGDAGTMTCAGYPGSQGHEATDAKDLAAWGVDYWKHDACYTPCVTGGVPQTCWDSRSPTKQYYATMRDALAGAGRPILFSMCQWGRDSVWTWGKDYGNSWRVSGDIANTWASLSTIAANAAGYAKYAGPGGFNDLDMLQVGNGVLNENEERAHVGLWMIVKSPILIGTDLSKVKESTLKILKNTVSTFFSLRKMEVLKKSLRFFFLPLLTTLHLLGFDRYQPRQARQGCYLLPARGQTRTRQW